MRKERATKEKLRDVIHKRMTELGPERLATTLGTSVERAKQMIETGKFTRNDSIALEEIIVEEAREMKEYAACMARPVPPGKACGACGTTSAGPGKMVMILDTEEVLCPECEKKRAAGKLLPPASRVGSESLSEEATAVIEVPSPNAVESSDVTATPPSPQEPDPTPKATNPPKARPAGVHLLMPVSHHGMMHFLTAWSVFGLLRKHPTLRMTVEKDTLPRVRNTLARRFLESDSEWAFLVDSDMVIPFGNGAWFRRRTGSNRPDEQCSIDALASLMSRGKQVVGGVYAARAVGGSLIVAADIKQTKTASDKDLIARIKKGPVDKCVEVPFAATGCLLVHRDVFEKIKAAYGEEWFSINPGEGGEDIQFCKRARDVGFSVWLDLAVHCGHVGNYCYLP